MPAQQEIVVPVLGLNVDVNPLAAPKGSLAVADNIMLRLPGTAQPCPAPKDVTEDPARLANFAPAASTHGVRVFCQGDRDILGIEIADSDPNGIAHKLRLSEDPTNPYTVVVTGTEFTVPHPIPLAPKASPGAAYRRDLAFSNKATQHTFSDGRHFLTSDVGVLTVDGVDTSSNRVLRMAGLISPPNYWYAETFAPSTTVKKIASAGQFVSYVALVRRKRGDKYTLYSAPSRPVVVTDAADFGVFITFKFSIPAGTTEPVLVDDEFVLYKTKAASTADGIIPVYYECGHSTVDLTMLAGASVGFADLVHDDDLSGAELYTNDGQDGPLNVNYMPPLSSDACAYAGSVFYANRCSWPTLSMRVGGKFGFFPVGGDAADRRYGIGARQFVPTGVVGAQLTGVSDAEIVGVQAGQLVAGDPSLSFATITSVIHVGVNNNTVNLSAPVTAGLFGTYNAIDQLTLTIGSTTIVVPMFIGSPSDPFGPTYHGLDSALSAVPGLRCWTDIAIGDLVAGIKSASTLTFVLTIPGLYTSFTASNITNFANYTSGASTVNSIQDTRRNILWYSKLQQPEAVSPLANIPVGAEEILRCVKVGQAMLVFCTDGLWTVVGDAANGFQVQQKDPKCILFHPSAVTTLGSNAYALTYTGILRIGEDGMQSVSADAIDSLLVEYLSSNSDRWTPTAVADPVNSEVRFGVNDGRTLVYNEKTQQWAARTDNMIHGAFDRGADVSGRTAPNVVVASDGKYNADGATAAATELRENPITAEAPANVKQWIDTNHFFEEDADGTFQVTYDGAISRSATTDADTSAKELHCRVPRRAARRPRLSAGFKTTAGTEFMFSGFRARFRPASDEVKR